ncbi:hypothetical protein AMECASPLE_029947, partial [Ameca splendens]
SPYQSKLRCQFNSSLELSCLPFVYCSFNLHSLHLPALFHVNFSTIRTQCSKHVRTPAGFHNRQLPLFIGILRSLLKPFHPPPDSKLLSTIFP